MAQINADGGMASLGDVIYTVELLVIRSECQLDLHGALHFRQAELGEQEVRLVLQCPGMHHLQLFHDGVAPRPQLEAMFGIF